MIASGSSICSRATIPEPTRDSKKPPPPTPATLTAVFGLAEAARKLKHEQEAADNYIIYLDANPDGPKAKAARKALSELNTAKKP